MNAIKHATTQFPVLDLIKNRWSPRAFSQQNILEKDLNTILEAASLAPSAMNEQPWRFVVAQKENKENFDFLVDLLVEGNKIWAKNADTLIICITKQTYNKNNKININAAHDTGLATQNLLLQAQSMDIYGHIMEGFDKEKAIQKLQLSEDFKPLTMIALGYLGDAEKLEEPLKTRELTPRSRKKLEEFVFSPSQNIQ